jgi:hypothetical protein
MEFLKTKPPFDPFAKPNNTIDDYKVKVDDTGKKSLENVNDSERKQEEDDSSEEEAS